MARGPKLTRFNIRNQSVQRGADIFAKYRDSNRVRRKIYLKNKKEKRNKKIFYGTKIDNFEKYSKYFKTTDERLLI